jgi:hypothetical protein
VRGARLYRRRGWVTVRARAPEEREACDEAAEEDGRPDLVREGSSMRHL